VPPVYPLEKIKNIPIALFAGLGDELASPTDVDWLNEQIKDTVVFYHKYNLGHMSFAIAKDMSFFQIDAIGLLKQYATNAFATTA
jgi:hypothetical protein